MNDIGWSQREPTTIYGDNQSSIRLIRNPEFHKRTKHIDVQYHYIREKYEDGEIQVTYVETNNQIADIFTKALTPERFARLRDMMGMVCVGIQ